MAKNSPGKEQVRYEVITQEDNTGDLLIPLPIPLLEQLGWKEGMEIEFGVNSNGQIILKRSSE